MKKNSTKNNTAPKVDHLKALAADLSAVLNNPACPALLYNAISDITTEMSNHIAHDSQEILERGLRAYTAFEAQRTGKVGAA